MRYLKGDVWSIAHRHKGWSVVTTNTVVKQNGDAVMGAGIAKQAATEYPSLPAALGRHIAKYGERLYISYPVICLPTKRDWRLPSDIELIRQGCIELEEFHQLLRSMQHVEPICLPKLGCGLGGLNWERQVRPVVDAILTDDRFIMVSNE